MRIGQQQRRLILPNLGIMDTSRSSAGATNWRRAKRSPKWHCTPSSGTLTRYSQGMTGGWCAVLSSDCGCGGMVSRSHGVGRRRRVVTLELPFRGCCDALRKSDVSSRGSATLLAANRSLGVRLSSRKVAGTEKHRRSDHEISIGPRRAIRPESREIGGRCAHSDLRARKRPED